MMTAADSHPGPIQRADDGRPRLIVTIDGPAGTGKSSVARSLARRLGVDFLDTGAMYRAATALSIDAGINLLDAPAVCELVARADIHFDWSKDPPEVSTGARDGYRSLASRIREPDVTREVAPLSSIPRLREHMVAKQRIIGAQHPRLVTEGRDQGSVVFPDADVKFYLDASARVRAARRADQIRSGGAEADEAQLLDEITQRDQVDKSKPVGPLVCPRDAYVVDTSHLTFEQVVEQLEQVVRIRVPGLGPAPSGGPR
ncbi:MAG: (d)CMP kinase [Phycisphaerales bacterium]